MEKSNNGSSNIATGIRDFEKMENLILEVREEGISTGTVEMMTLDFASLSSVRKFADEIIERNIQVQMLINAGAHETIFACLRPYYQYFWKLEIDNKYI